jgi:hypothetical protein
MRSVQYQAGTPKLQDKLPFSNTVYHWLKERTKPLYCRHHEKQHQQHHRDKTRDVDLLAVHNLINLDHFFRLKISSRANKKKLDFYIKKLISY